MIQYTSVVVITAALFLLMILSLAMKPHISGKITGYMLVLSAAGGLIIYGYGYSYVVDNQLLAIIKALLSVCGMFVGKNELANIAAAPHISDIWVVILAWTLHTFALYTSASAAITTIGGEALKQLRLALSRTGNLTLIYGTGPDALALGKECHQERGMSVVFVDGEPGSDAVTAIGLMGAALRTDANAVHPGLKAMKSMGIRSGRRQIHVYCMKNEVENYRYANELKAAMEAAGITPSQTSLVLMGDEERLAGYLQEYSDGTSSSYGFGNVAVFQTYEQVARLLIRHCPPWQVMGFDMDGVAKDDFEALVIGFGSCGQSVLKALVRNGQYCGSHFRAFVMDKNGKSAMGFFECQCPSLFEHYDISFLETDARSIEAFHFLMDHKDSLKYVVVATMDEKLNQEISGQISRFFRDMGKNIPVTECSGQGIRIHRRINLKLDEYKLITRETMDFSKTDRLAMGFNHKYSSNKENSLWDDWRSCDYFSRMSCRAVADFIPANLHMAHLSMDRIRELKGENLPLTEVQKAVLGQTEHMRWCAFHYTMGWTPMSEEEWQERAMAYEAEVKENGSSSIRIGKNSEDKRHACMVDWEELDALSEKELAVTGKDPVYKQKDIDNVLEIPVLLTL